MKIHIVILFFTACFAAILTAAERVALVIGNQAYQTLPPLSNAAKDAEDVTAMLRKSGFFIVELPDSKAGGALTDLKREQILAALKTFTHKAQGAKTGLIYYAGHGVEVDGKNYLVPVDATMVSDQWVTQEAIPMQAVQEALRGAKAAMNIIVLDCCRDNPTRSAATKWRSTGLAKMKADEIPGASMIMFSTSPGKTALDGQPGGNSPFTAAFLKYFADRDTSIFDSCVLVSSSVKKNALGQEPWMNMGGPPESFSEITLHGTPAKRTSLLALTEKEHQKVKEMTQDAPVDALNARPYKYYQTLCDYRSNAYSTSQQKWAGNNAEMKEGTFILLERMRKLFINLVDTVYEDETLKGKTAEQFVEDKLRPVFELCDMQIVDEVEDGNNGSAADLDLGMRQISIVEEMIVSVVKASLPESDYRKWEKEWIEAGEAGKTESEEDGEISSAPQAATNDSCAFLMNRQATRNELSSWSAHQLRHGINYIYARNGYPFLNKGKEAVRAEFLRCDWYRPEAALKDGQATTRMNVTARANMELLAQMEKESKAAIAPQNQGAPSRNVNQANDPLAVLGAGNVAEQQLRNLSLTQLQYAINYMYARRGYIFADMNTTQHFRDTYNWYAPVTGLTMADCEKLMTSAEKTNFQNLARIRNAGK